MLETKSGKANGPKPEAASGTEVQVERRPEAAPAVWRTHPLEMMRRVADEMERAFEEFPSGIGRSWPGILTRIRERLPREVVGEPGMWSPRVEVLEREGKFVVRAELPGLTRQEIEVEVTDDALTIKGERKSETKKEGEGYFYSERSYGQFSRTIPLPEGVTADAARAEFHDGVLEVAIPRPKAPVKEPRKIEITPKR